MSTSSRIRIRAPLMAFAALSATTCLNAPIFGYGAAAAAKARPGAAESEVVYFADLDLSRKADQAKLKHRILLATTRVCDFEGYLDLACYEVVSAEAWNQGRTAIANRSVPSIAAAILVIGSPNR